MPAESNAEELSAVFARCLDELLSGSPVEVCLQHSGAHQQEIRPLLMAVQAARLADAVPSPSPEKARRSKLEFLAASVREGIINNTLG